MTNNPHRRFPDRRPRNPLFLSAVLSVFALSGLILGCRSDDDGERVSSALGVTPTISPGDRCQVGLRRDALGMARQNPTSWTDGSFNDADMLVQGEFIGQDENWFIVARAPELRDKKFSREIWIPRSSILVVEVFRTRSAEKVR